MLGSKTENPHSAKKLQRVLIFEIQPQCEIRVVALSRTLTSTLTIDQYVSWQKTKTQISLVIF